jgi:fibronectin type 3 domain-containing protein
VNYDYVVLNWSAVENATGYTVYRDNAAIWNGTSVTYSDGDVNYNTTYLYTINAYDFQGTNGSTSDAISVTTPELLNAPNLSLTITGTEATLSWSSISSAESYKVYQDNEFLAQITDLTDLTYTLDIGTGSNTCFTVTAINSYGVESSPSNEECGTGELTAPSLSLTISGTEATLTWGSILSAESYRIYQDNEFLVEITELTYTIDIGTGTNICFTVTAINSYGVESSPSNEECGTGF